MIMVIFGPFIIQDKIYLLPSQVKPVDAKTEKLPSVKKKMKTYIV